MMASDDREYINQLLREQAQMADEIAFWAYQAKHYYAACHGIDLDKNWKTIEAAFEQARVAENAERLGHVEPAHEIGS